MKRAAPKIGSKTKPHKAKPGPADARFSKDREILVLSARDTEIVVNAILNPREPTPALRGAARHYKKIMGS